jgi:hypothetical protein
MPELLESGYPKEPLAALAAPNPPLGWFNLSLQSMPTSISCPRKQTWTKCHNLPGPKPTSSTAFCASSAVGNVSRTALTNLADLPRQPREDHGLVEQY